MSLRSLPLKRRHFIVSFPLEHVVQVTLNRPEKLNCIDKATSQEVAEVWEHLDNDETLWVGIITGVGRAFCTGADLHEWHAMNQSGVVNSMAAPGLAGLPRRSGKKPIIAAVNGLCLGGGFEMVANCDLVVASASAVFSLPEAARGIVPVAGCLPRLARSIGVQRTMDLVLTGREVDASTMAEWGLVSRVVVEEEQSADDGGGKKSNTSGEAKAGANTDDKNAALRVALQVAQAMCRNSPDALVVGRLGVRLAWEEGDVERAVTRLEDEWYPRLVAGPNFAEGIQAFVERRAPRWLDSKL